MTKKRWLITGVSSGLGKALMNAVVAHGDRVAGTVRTLPNGNPYAGAGPGEGALFALDVTKPEIVESGIAAALDWMGGVDVVVNNAGAGVFGPVEVCDVEDFRTAMEVNFFGLVSVTKAALPHLRNARGTLVNVASMAAMIAMGGTGPYCASKHAVLGLSEALRQELAPFGVRVIVTLPGGFRTDFWGERSNTIREGLSELYADHPSGQIRARSQAHVGHEMGDPAKLAQLMIEVVNSDDPPLYLVAGGDALDYVSAKRDALATDLEAGRAVAQGTAFT